MVIDHERSRCQLARMLLKYSLVFIGRKCYLNLNTSDFKLGHCKDRPNILNPFLQANWVMCRMQSRHGSAQAFTVHTIQTTIEVFKPPCGNFLRLWSDQSLSDAKRVVGESPKRLLIRWRMSYHDSYTTFLPFIQWSKHPCHAPWSRKARPRSHSSWRYHRAGWLWLFLRGMCYICGCISFFDTLEAIIHMELARVSSRAVVDGLLAGLVIGLPPILNYGSPQLQQKVVPDVRVFIVCLIPFDINHSRHWRERNI
jgi:hypothetical protein